MPRLITSIPASRFASTLRSSSANMYGGIASRRSEGPSSLFFVGCCHRSRKTRRPSVCRGPGEQLAELSGVDLLGPTGQLDVEIVADLDLELPTIELDHASGCSAATQEGGHRGPAGAGPRGERLPHAALEDPGADAVPRAEEAHVGAVRESSCARSPGPIATGRAPRAHSPTSIAHCGLPIETCWKRQVAPAGLQLAAAVLGPRREVCEAVLGAAELQGALALGADRRLDRPRLRQDRELVRVGPPDRRR